DSDHYMLDLVGSRKRWYLLSLILLVPGIVSLIFNGLELGIDFTGGTSWEIETSNPVSAGQVRDVLSEHGHGEAIVQISDDTTVLIRMSEISEGSAEKTAIEDAFREEIGEFEELSMVTVGPSVGTEIRNRSVYAVGLASI